MRIPFINLDVLRAGAVAKTGAEQPVIQSDDPRLWTSWGLDGVSLDARAKEEIPEISQASAQLRANVGWLYAVVNRIAKETCRYELKMSVRRGDQYEDADDLRSRQFMRYIDKPYPYGDARSLVETMSTQINLTGKTTSYVRTAGGAGNVFEGLVPINPAGMRYEVDEDGILWRWLHSAKGRYLSLEQVFYAHYADPTDIYRPLSPVRCISSGLELYKQVMAYNWKWLRNDTQASAYGTPKEGVVIDQPKYEKLKEWARKQVGKIGGIEFLPVGMDLVARPVGQRQLQFGKDLPTIAQEICNGYGYMLPLLNGQNINRSVMEVCQYLTLELCVRPHALTLESALNSQVTHRFLDEEHWLYFDIPAFRFSDDTAKILEQELAHNLISVEEYRGEHNRDPKFTGTPPTQRSVVTVPAPPEESDDEQPPTKGRTLRLIASKSTARASQFKSEERYFSWKAFDALVDSALGPFSDALTRSFKRQGAQFKQKAQAAHDRGDEVTIALFDQDAARVDVVKVSTPHVAAGAKAGYKNGARLARARVSYVSSLRRETQLRGRVTRMADQVTETTVGKLTELLARVQVRRDGKAAPTETVGVSFEEFLKEVDALFDGFDYRAVAGAETQLVGSLNWGADQAYGDAPYVDGSEWLSQGDGDVRDEHQIDGEVANLGEEFSNGLHFPGDVEGSQSDAGNLINCRCATLPYLKPEGE